VNTSAFTIDPDRNVRILLKRYLKKALQEVKSFSVVPRELHHFIVVAQERTGSTLLSDLLSLHPSILMDRHHFFTPNTWPKHRYSGLAFTRRNVRGYKFKMADAPLQHSPEDTRSFLADRSPELKVVWLRRENKFRQAVSSAMADARGLLHVWKDKKGVHSGNGRVTINSEDLASRIEYFERLTRFQERALTDIQHIEVTYESDLLREGNHQDAVNRVFDYLGLDTVPVQARLKKLSSKDLSESIANYDELMTALQHTPHVQYLEDSEIGLKNLPDRA